jgi:N-acetyl-gamma-glutamyl-phosphate reductase
MAVTTVVPVASPESAIAAIRERYASEPFVELVGETPPETRHVRGSNRIRIGWRGEKGHLILMSVIDNLWKGASGQAVQNMNIRFGFPEETGLTQGIEL